jgi:hypothetical protein
MNARAQTPRRYNHVDVCLQCGGIANTASPDCAHPRVSKVELTPTVKRALTQLRGARSYVRYLTERFNEMVQLELLAQAEVPNDAGARRGRKNAVMASDVPVPAPVDERQVSLFG